MPAPGIDADRLAEHLRALANATRLRILEALQEPARASDIRLRAGEERAGFSADRILSRPAITQHLEVLEAAGLVRRVGDAYVVDQPTMFSVLAEVGGLARLRAVALPDVETTLAIRQGARRELPARPRLLVVGGPEDGRGFPLSGTGPWRVGRGPECDVRLDYDPHASRLHLLVERRGGAFHVRAAPGVKNAPTLDDAPLVGSEPLPLPCGAVLSVGASRLVLQA